MRPVLRRILVLVVSNMDLPAHELDEDVVEKVTSEKFEVEKGLFKENDVRTVEVEKASEFWNDGKNIITEESMEESPAATSSGVSPRPKYRTRAVAMNEEIMHATGETYLEEEQEKATILEKTSIKEDPEEVDVAESVQLMVKRELESRAQCSTWTPIFDTPAISDDGQSNSSFDDEMPGLSVEGHLRGIFGGDPLTMILDSGGSHSLLSHAVWHRIGYTSLDTLTPQPVVRNSEGQELEVCGRARIPLVFKGMVYAVSFWIVRKMEHRVLLGVDFLRNHESVIDMAAMRLYMKNLPQGVAMVWDRSI